MPSESVPQNLTPNNPFWDYTVVKEAKNGPFLEEEILGPKDPQTGKRKPPLRTLEDCSALVLHSKENETKHRFLLTVPIRDAEDEGVKYYRRISQAVEQNILRKHLKLVNGKTVAKSLIEKLGNRLPKSFVKEHPEFAHCGFLSDQNSNIWCKGPFECGDEYAKVSATYKDCVPAWLANDDYTPPIASSKPARKPKAAGKKKAANKKPSNTTICEEDDNDDPELEDEHANARGDHPGETKLESSTRRERLKAFITTYSSDNKESQGSGLGPTMVMNHELPFHVGNVLENAAENPPEPIAEDEDAMEVDSEENAASEDIGSESSSEEQGSEDQNQYDEPITVVVKVPKKRKAPETKTHVAPPKKPKTKKAAVSFSSDQKQKEKTPASPNLAIPFDQDDERFANIKNVEAAVRRFVANNEMQMLDPNNSNQAHHLSAAFDYQIVKDLCEKDSDMADLYGFLILFFVYHTQTELPQRFAEDSHSNWLRYSKLMYHLGSEVDADPFSFDPQKKSIPLDWVRGFVESRSYFCPLYADLIENIMANANSIRLFSSSLPIASEKMRRTILYVAYRALTMLYPDDPELRPRTPSPITATSDLGF